MVSQSYDQRTLVRAFVINRDAQARRLVCRTLQRCGYGVSECDSPLFGQDEYAGESLVVVDVRSMADEVRDFLLWLKQSSSASAGEGVHVMALATGVGVDWENHPDRLLWDEILMLPAQVERMCGRFKDLSFQFQDLQQQPENFDMVSPFELDESVDDEAGYVQRSLSESERRAAELSPSRLDGLKAMVGAETIGAGLPSNELFHEMAESVPYGMVVLGRDEKFVYGNAQHAELLGVGVGEVENIESWLRMLCRGDEQCREVVASWRKHVWQKQLVRTYALRSTSGEVKDIEFRPKLMSDGGLLLTMSDVSDRARSEEAWLLSEVKFKTLFASKSVGMALVDRTGRICIVNAALQKMLDYSATELLAMAFDDFVKPSDRAGKREFEVLAKRESELSAEEVSLCLCKKGGEMLAVFLGISFMEESGGPFTAYLVREDEEQGKGAFSGVLKESMLQNRALLQVMPDTVLMFDHRGKVSDVNSSESAQDTVFSESRLKGGFLSDVLPSLWQACERAGLNELEFHSNEGLVLEFAMQEAGVCRAHVAGCGQGEYMALIREKGQGSEPGAIELGVEALSERLEAVEEMGSCEWADQLQTLTSLLNLEMDAIPADTEKQQRSALQKHQGRIRAMACLRAAMLEPVSGASAQVSVPNYLKALIEDLLKSSPLASELDLEAEVDCVTLSLSARKAFALGLYVTELVSNAIEHGLAKLPGGRFYVRLRRSDREAVLLVGDNGEGLPSGFDLGRVETLGFRVVKSLATQLGARLEIRPGENTEFLIRFPLGSKS